MPRLVLTSSSIAYNLVALAQVINKNFPASPRELTIEMPATAIEAGNGAADTVKIGSPNSNTAPTDVSTIEGVLVTGGNKQFRSQNGVPAAEMWLKGTSANNVIYVEGI